MYTESDSRNGRCQLGRPEPAEPILESRAVYPLRFEPVYQSYVWGGERIPQLFNRHILQGTFGPFAESWEISDRDEGMSIVANGPSKGQTLRQLGLYERFPLLIKIIDARENLSVQVHPDEALAGQTQTEPKAEMWIALADSVVYAGLKPHVTRNTLRKAIARKEVETLLEKVLLRRGEALFIPGGTVHAIGAGALLLEVQQNSNTTYRLYDWERVGRMLHLEEGFRAIRWKAALPRKTTQFPVVTPHFTVDRLFVETELTLVATPHLYILFCMEGQAFIGAEPFSPGMTYLIPPHCHSVQIRGKCQIIIMN